MFIILLKSTSQRRELEEALANDPPVSSIGDTNLDGWGRCIGPFRTDKDAGHYLIERGFDYTYEESVCNYTLWIGTGYYAYVKEVEEPKPLTYQIEI